MTTRMVDLDGLLAGSLSRRTAVKAGLFSAVALGGIGINQPVHGQAGGRLVIGKPGEVLNLDPHFSASQITWEIQAVAYESLVFLDDALGPIPGLAESWETPDDRTYVFALRQGVMFHNGREMKADDVVFSLRRVLESPESWWNVKMGPSLEPDPATVEAAASAEALGTPTAVGNRIGVTVEATGDYEVTATLTEPYSPFLQSLSATTTSIVPAAEVESGEIDLTTMVVGTGPFRVVEHLPDQRWVFGKVTDYWQPGGAQLDEVVWQIIPDESARVASLRTGEVQLALFENPAVLDLLASDDNVTAVEQTTTNYYILFVNGNQPELADQRVRQAISLAMDREEINLAALFGRGTVTGPIASAFSELATPLADLPFYTRDVERARALLAEAGVGEGLALQLLVTPALAATVTMAEVLQEQLAEAGIEIEIVQRDLATFVADYTDGESSQLAISWWAGYSDPYLILVELGNGQATFIGMDDPAVDDLITRAAAEADPAMRVTIMRELEAAVATLGNFQPMVTRNNFVAYRNDQLGNVTFAAADGFGLPLWHILKDITLTQ
ncbi:MAG: ABC transporter substrate-binding protein [Chloroflexia bacterium]|nr:ABC transporter substrate-binding protein [Chloroflexia bacterium]